VPEFIGQISPLNQKLARRTGRLTGILVEPDVTQLGDRDQQAAFDFVQKMPLVPFVQDPVALHLRQPDNPEAPCVH